MIHASVELVNAMLGFAPTLAELPRPISAAWLNAVKACDLAVANERIVWAYARGCCEDSWGPVTCPDCLRAMRDARGPDWDVIAANLASVDALATAAGLAEAAEHLTE